VEVLQAQDNAGEEEASVVLLKPAQLNKVIAKVTSLAVVHYQVKAFAILKGIPHIDNKGVS
jgi:hypothetical protein